MKKIFYATTALVTAGLIAGVAGEAAAQNKPIEVKIKGYHRQFVTLIPNARVRSYGIGGNSSTSAQGPRIDYDTNTVNQIHNSEICFLGQTTLDNGLTVGFNVQLEANTSGDQIDESFLFLDHDDFGRILLGDENNAAYLMQVASPNAGLSVNNGDIVGPILGSILPQSFDQDDTPIDGTNLRFYDNDSGKISYFTPRFGGVQLGVSYIPQFEPGGGDNNSQITRTGNNNAAGPVENGYAVGLNYKQTFDDVGLQGSVGYMGGDVAPANGNRNLRALAAGAQVSVAGFSFGGSIVKSEGDAPATRFAGARYSAAGLGYEVGAEYEVGPYAVSINYLKGKTTGVHGNGSRNFFDVYSLGGTYTMGPGVALVGSVFYWDADGENAQDVPAGNGAAVRASNGVGAATGVQLSF